MASVIVPRASVSPQVIDVGSPPSSLLIALKYDEASRSFLYLACLVVAKSSAAAQ